MPPVLTVVAPEDLSVALTPILESEFAAFWPHEEIHDILYPGPPTATNIATIRARHLKDHDPHAVYLQIVDADDLEHPGRVLAHAKWKVFDTADTVPESSPTGDVSYYGAEGSDERKYAQYWMNRIMKMRTEKLPKGPHLLLEMCFTHPEHERRGYGRQIVMWGCQRADEIGCEAIVEATVAGRPLYEKCGFVVEEIINDGEEHRWPGRPQNFWYFMRRPAK